MRYLRTRARSRRFLLVCVAVTVVALSGMAAIAYAAYPNNSVTTYTGCLTSGGSIVGVAANPTTPKSACGSGSSLIHLSGGTITRVTAGTGLTTTGSGGTGGTGFINNGFATLGLLPAFALPQSCSDGQLAKWDATNSDWKCADDQNTTYSNGTGLDLSNANVFSINSNYQLPQNCTSGQFPSSNGAGAGFGCGSDTTYDGTDFATSGQDCPPDQFATGIDANGNLKCARHDLNGSPCTSPDGESSAIEVSVDSTGNVSLQCQTWYSSTRTDCESNGGTFTALYPPIRINGTHYIWQCDGLSISSMDDPTFAVMANDCTGDGSGLDNVESGGLDTNSNFTSLRCRVTGST